MIALYSFDSFSGSLLRDLSGNGNDGTVYGATWVDGRFGRALAFDGVDDYAQAVGYYHLSATNALTIEAWVKLTGRHEYSNIVQIRNCCILRMLISPGLHPFYDPGSYSDVEVTTYKFEFGRWTHYALVIAGGQTAKVFIDGNLVSTSPNGVPPTLPDMYEAVLIGGVHDSNVFTQGLIDEVRIYNRALSEVEIRTSMASSATGLIVAEAEKLLSQLRERGVDASGVEQKLWESRSAQERADDESAQSLAFQAGSLARSELRKYAVMSRGASTDYGKVLFIAMTALFLFGTLTASALIWGAWKGDGAS